MDNPLIGTSPSRKRAGVAYAATTLPLFAIAWIGISVFNSDLAIGFLMIAPFPGLLPAWYVWWDYKYRRNNDDRPSRPRI